MRSFIKSDGSIRSWDIALIPVVPAYSCPSVSLILLHYRQHLPFLHGDGSLTGAWEIVECCTLTNRCSDFLFLKVVIKFSVDGLGRVGVI